TGERVPAAADPGLVGLLEARRRRDDAIAQLRTMAIAVPVDRRQHLPGETRRLLQNVVRHVEREVGIDAIVDRALELADVTHHEQHFVDGGAIGHGQSSTSSALFRRANAEATGVASLRPCRRSAARAPALACSL